MIAVELHHAKPLRVHYLIAEYRRTLGDCRMLLQHRGETLAVEYVVPENQTYRGIRDERRPDEEGLRETLRSRLHGVAQIDAELTTIAEHSLKGWLIFRRGYDENVSNPGQHEHGQRVVDHRLVVDGEELLTHAQGERVQARALSTRQDDAFHMRSPSGPELPRPIRASWYAPAPARCHHASFCRYHSTVLRSPDSMVS